MKRDTTLALAIAAGIGYAVVVGAMSSGPAAGVSPNQAVAVEVTWSGTGRVERITDTARVAAVCRWLDAVVETPGSFFDLQLLSPPSNELVVRFASGEEAKFFFSGADPRRTAAPDRPRRWRRQGREDAVLVHHRGHAYVAGTLPQPLLNDRAR